MKRSDLQYDLPPERIAQEALDPRDSARMLVQTLGQESCEHASVADLADWLQPGDLLVFNDTKVLPARLWVRRASGARIELLFLEPADQGTRWLCMVRPAKKPKPGEELLAEGGLIAHMIRRIIEPDGQPGAYWVVELKDSKPGQRSVPDLLEEVGEMPLPPYIRREPGGRVADRNRYQTVFCKHRGAVAAPTAGLHFTPELMLRLEQAGISSCFVTLHVGLGTFLPIQVEDLDEHRMHEERFEVGEAVVQAVRACREAGGRVLAVGTTSVRALEAASAHGELRACSGRTDLFIQPGYAFRCVQGLLTNFHLPGSTLLLLVSALLGRERLMALYREAIAEQYRFYSYGDAMLILPAAEPECGAARSVGAQH